MTSISEAPDPANTRIITTLGHVDHGKTTLMDALLAANNIISTRMAGKLRYLDSREDEQERGITMESSAVSLKFHVNERSASGDQLKKTFFVNMIDTPGHVDFSSEVSSASRLCDGALILVDVVEGVCTQTIAVLRQAWHDQLRPILVINKFDRLITELRLSPTEAQHHLSRLIEQVNAVMGSFFAGERMEDDLRWREDRERRLAAKKASEGEVADIGADTDSPAPEDEFQEKDDEDIYFAPERGNVVFASAIDGWGFRIGRFAQLYAAKLGMKEATLRRVLWGDFFLDSKTKKVVGYKHLRGRALKPLFVQFVLDNIWAIYDAVLLNPNPDKVAKIIGTLNLKVPPRELKSKETRPLLSTIMSQWLALSTCVIQAIIDVVPAPSSSQALRIPRILYPDLHVSASGPTTIQPKNKLEQDLFSCGSDNDACIVAYVSKMFAVPEKDLPENKKRPLSAEEMRERARAARAARQPQEFGDGAAPASVDLSAAGEQHGEASETSVVAKASEEENEEQETVLGFARLYSGTLRIGTTIQAVLPKYDTALPSTHPRNTRYITHAQVEGLYVMMGRELVSVDSVRAGNTFAIRGLGGKVWRSATLCAPSADGTVEPTTEVNAQSTASGKDADSYLINLGGVTRSAPPIVRVALEPERPADMQKLLNGLKLLSQSDPCVETFQQQTGEHVIVTAGELHLERCLKDLRERFARVEIQVSKPIVPFRETAVRGTDMAPTKTPNTARGTIHGASSGGLVTFTIRASPLPQELYDFVVQNHDSVAKLHRDRRRADMSPRATDDGPATASADEANEDAVDEQADVRRSAKVLAAHSFWDALEASCKDAGSEWRNIAERIWIFGPQKVGGCLLIDARQLASGKVRSLKQHGKGSQPLAEDDAGRLLRDMEAHLETGFQLATFQGPLCAEPVEGLAYFVESLEIKRDETGEEIDQNRIAQQTGSLISAVRDACRNGMLDWSPRLLLAMYSCDIQASTDVLGKVYAVVARRRGRIVAEEMKEGTSFFTISALLPVVESFGFADEIRKRTSGAASPQLVFSGYELLDLDPFWVPTTEEELEDLGEKSDRTNVAKSYMDGVRERKGLFVDRKIVEFAEKQRTLKK
ncbi:hypothetical protein HGRIS_005851 [Hohenbuehelia grisea]|uniref:Tr-type G domain-containing protein n=1 Tax=Hohenbuehelia grisea TaxID=104357 RepID=A0ABR3K077_9AGAR